MNCSPQQLSNVTKCYLLHFYKILDEMIKNMTDAELTGSISHNFIVQMIPHHMAAIEMSRNLLQYTTFIPLQSIAENIIKEQTKSINSMLQILENCAALENSSGDLCLYQRRFEQIAQTMFAQMKNAPADNQLNANFMQEMIPHHCGAIRMSENALRFNLCPGLVPILRAIITSQRAGVREMERLLQCFSSVK